MWANKAQRREMSCPRVHGLSASERRPHVILSILSHYPFLENYTVQLKGTYENLTVWLH